MKSRQEFSVVVRSLRRINRAGETSGAGLILVLFLYFNACECWADGLIYQLPPDGTWARYEVKSEGEFDVGDGQKQKMAALATLTVSSVGQVTRNEQECWWIELKMESKSEGVYPKLLLKMLITEEHCRRGHDPLSHALLTFFDPKPADAIKAPPPYLESYINEGFNRIQYEIDRFRNVFPKSLDNPKSLERETVETSAGKFGDCEVITGTSRYDGPTLDDGRWILEGTHRVVLHPEAPYGIVSMQTEAKGREITPRHAVSGKVNQTLVLVAVGQDAVSELPNGKEQDQEQ